MRDFHKDFVVEKVQFKEGYIEVLRCDASYEPNLPSRNYSKSGYDSVYYRLHGTLQWLPSKLFKSNINSYFNFKDEYTAEKVWSTVRTGFIR